MSAQRKKNKKKREPINFDEFKYPKPAESDPEPEDEAPKEESDCCDRCLFSLFGYILLYCGIIVIFFSERDHKYSQRDISYMRANLQRLDIAQQKPAQINTLLAEVLEHSHPLHFTDHISDLNEKNMIVMDDRTDLSYPGIALKINTEMYQWIETEETLRKEGTTVTESKYTYTKQWSNAFHDSSEFNAKDEYYNPQPTVSQLSVRNIWVDQIIVGSDTNVQFYLSKSLYTKLSQRDLWKNVTQKSAEYSQMEMWEMRDGYLFRAYDKAESWFAEPEMNEDSDDSDSEESDTDTDTDTETEDSESEESDSDVFESEERVRLDKPRTMIGDIRMTVFALDTRGAQISYLGGLKHLSEWNQYVLVPWKSLTNHKFAMLKYGRVDSEAAINEFSTENVMRLWLTRLFTFVFIFCGLMILQNVLQTTLIQLRVPLGPFPIQTWLKCVTGAFALTAILWLGVIVIAYVIGIVHLALSIVVLIVIGLFVNNKSAYLESEEGGKSKHKHKKHKPKSL